MPSLRLPTACCAAALVLLPGARAAAQTGAARTPAIELLASLDVPATLVELAGSRAYVAGGETLRVVDLADPARPAALGTFTAPGPIWALHAAPPYVYLTAGLEGMHIVDVSDPRAPILAATHQTAGQALGVTASGTAALVINLMTGLEVVDTSDKSAPTLLQTRATPGYQWGIAGTGATVLVVDQPSGVHLFDLSDPQVPAARGVYATEQPAQTVVLGDGGRAYVVYARTGRVEILDVADPSAPRLLGRYQPARSSGRFQRVAVERFTMVVPVGEDGVEVVDVSNPAAPVRRASRDTPGHARSAALSGNLAAVADGGALLLFRLD